MKQEDFRACLERLELTIGQFAKRLDIKPNTVSTWMVRGQIPYWVPHLLAAWRLLDRLGYRPPTPTENGDPQDFPDQKD